MRAIAALVLGLLVTSPAFAAYADLQSVAEARLPLLTGAFETTVLPARLKGPLADGASFSLNLSVNRTGAPLPTGITTVTVTAPRDFAITDASADPTFVRTRLDQHAEDGGPLAGRWYASFLGLRDLGSGDNFTMSLATRGAIGDGLYTFDMQTCDGPGACTTGPSAAPAFEVDGTPPRFDGFVASPSPAWPSTTYSSGVARLDWRIADLGNVSHYALSESPLPVEPEWTSLAGTLPSTFVLTAGTDGLRTIHARVRDELGNTAGRSAAILVDLAPPSIVSDIDVPMHGVSGWWNASPTLRATASDGTAGSGVASLRAGLDDAPLAEGSDILVPQGEHLAYFNATDRVGWSSQTSFGVRVDLTDPAIDPPVVSPDLDGWHTSTPTTALFANDTHSGIATTRHRLLVDGVPGAWADTTIGEEIALNADAERVAVEFAVGDNAGRASAAYAGPVRIDRIVPDRPTLQAPAITGDPDVTLTWSEFSTSGPSGFGAWRVEEDVNDTWVEIGAPASTSFTVLNLSHNTSRTWRVVAVSAAGLENASEPKSTLADLTAPNVEARIEPAFANGSWWTGPNVEAVLVLDEDATEIVDGSVYWVAIGEDNSSAPFVEGTTRIPLADDPHVSIGWSAIDSADHEARGMLGPFGVDTLSPDTTLSLSAPAAGADGWHTEPVTVFASCSDATSGCATTFVSVDGAPEIPAGEALLDRSGTRSARAWSRDIAGHAGARAELLDIKIDLVAPVVVLDPVAATGRDLPTLFGNVTVGPSGGLVRVEINGVLRATVATNGEWNVTGLDATSDGIYDIGVTVVDGAGRVSPAANESFVLDRTLPKLVLSLPATSRDVSAALSLLADETLAEPARVWLLTAEGWIEIGNITAPGSLALPLPSDGEHRVRVDAVDLAGNAANATASTRRDTVPPEVVLTSPAEGAFVRAGDVELTFLAPDAAIVGVRIDGGAWIAAGRGPDENWSARVALAEGPHALEARAEDDAGNVARSLVPTHVVADATPPIATLAFTPSVAGDLSQLTAHVEEANGIASMKWSFGDGESAACTGACLTIEHAYATGTYEVRAFVVDVAGHATEARANITVSPAPQRFAPTPSPPAPEPPPAAEPMPIRAAFEAPGVIATSVVLKLEAAPDSIHPDAAYAWSFGDGETATGRVVAHTWAAPGEYELRLVVRVGERSATAVRLVRVDAAAPAAPEPSPAEGSADADGAPPTEPVGEPPTPPVTRVEAPTGMIASPATITFDAGPNAVVYWRIAGESAWSTQASAIIGGDGVVVVEFYALGPGGPEPRRKVTLDLDGLDPVVSNVEARASESGLIIVRARAEDAHPARVEAHVRDLATGEARVVEMTSEGGGIYGAQLDLPDGRYEVGVRGVDSLGRETVVAANELIVGEANLESTGDIAGAIVRTPGPRLALVLLAMTLAAVLAGRRRR